jgi:sugar transferase (PEP-CTERM system associated)
LIRFLNAYFPKRTFFLGVSEACLVAFAFLVATVARLGVVNAGIVLSDEQGFLKIILVSGFVIVCMYYFDLYDSSVLANYGKVLTRVIQTLGTLSILLALIFSLYPTFELGRGIFLIGCALVGFFLLCWRGVFFKLSALPRFAERVLILGDSELSDFLASELPFRKELGFNIVGHVRYLQSRNENLNFATNEQSEEIVRSIEPYRPERIVVAMGDRRGKLPVDALLRLKSRGVDVQDGVELYEAVTGKIPIESLRLGWLLFSPGFRLSLPIVIYKRVFSVFFAVVGLILASPLMILIALVVRWSSTGPVIFRQSRVGQNGKIFTLYKIRTMVDGADQDGKYRPAESNDIRCTRIGRILRRTRIDELPQLFNILRGDMHFVGPRPFVPNQEQACLDQIPYYRQRWVAKPGATGWAQVNRGYCASLEDNIDKLGYDLFYIKNISVGLDLLIMFKTLKILLLGRGSR